MTLQINDQAPDFELLDQNGESHKLSDYKGKKLVLYFYPRDNTPGCTTEACSFRDSFPALKAAGIAVLGVSADTVKSHAKFEQKFQLPFTLLSDPDHTVCELYGVWGEKKFMGRTFMGINRTTFLINPDGTIREIMLKVKPDGHAQDILKRFTD